MEIVLNKGEKTCVSLMGVPCGKDWSIAIYGGETPHIGAVSMAVYEKERNSATVSTITSYGHRDDRISSYAAKEISAALGTTVTVSAGLHIDDATQEDIRALEDNMKKGVARLISRIREKKDMP